ncbi:unnamed protein product [Blepharisma stoltei]|uniref:Uncharacterized protein n=1 Tax=Blepharisma stoltei TaxID=1481888 RepID=A0AAU9JZJ0_9CILI|nr:unnamed protein product [Blepharisma stoltei]
MLNFIEWLSFIIGVWTLVKIILDLFYTLKTFFAKTDFSLYGRGSWALVTGASDGIGLGFSEFLASQGFNIILIGRNPEKLKKLAQSIEEKFPIKTRCIIKDFSLSAKDPQNFFKDIKDQTRDLDVSILVNNIGYGPGPKVFNFLPSGEILNTMALNLWPIAFLSRLYMPDLVSRKQRSAIINLSSIISVMPFPRSAIYCGGKSFDHLFSLITAEEAKYLAKNNNTSIDVLSLRPGYVDTPLAQKIKVKPLLITVDQCVESACNSLGAVNYTSGHWKHQLFYLFGNSFKPLLSPFFGKLARKMLESSLKTNK